MDLLVSVSQLETQEEISERQTDVVEALNSLKADLKYVTIYCSGSYSQLPGLLQRRRISRAASGSVQSPPVCSSSRRPTRPWLTRACTGDVSNP